MASTSSIPANGELRPAISRRAQWLQRALGLLVLAAAIYFLYRFVGDVGWREVGERISRARPALVALAIGLLVAQLVLWAARQRLSIRRITPTPPGWTIFLALVATAAANFLLPFARLLGGLMRARYLSRTSEPREPKRLYYGAVLFDQTVHFSVMGTVAVVGLVVGAALVGRPVLAAAFAGAVTAAVAGGWLWVRLRSGNGGGGGVVRFLERRAERGEGLIGKLLSGSEAAAKVFLLLVGDGRLWAKALVLGAGVFACVVAAQWATFFALDEPVNPLFVVITLALGLSAGVLLGTPGGLGTTEAAMIALYGAFGVGRVEAATAVLLFRALQFAVVLGVGLPAMAFLEPYSLAVGKRRRAAGEDE